MITKELLKSVPADRIIPIQGVFKAGMDYTIIKKLLECDSLNTDPILLYINSPGGSLGVAYAIAGIVKILKSPVITYASGQASSAAALVLMSGTAGHRCSDKNTEIMIHELSFQLEPGEELQKERLTYFNDLKKANVKFICDVTKQNVKKVTEHLKAETYFNAESAKKYGIIDSVI